MLHTAGTGARTEKGTKAWIARRLGIVAALIGLALALLPTLPAHAGGYTARVASEMLRINFGDFQSRAALTYPAGIAGGSPTLILIPGSGLEDMDADICAGTSSVPLSHNFLDIARYLTPRGFAVLRYNKHYVTGPCHGDLQAFYSKLDLQQMLADAEQVLRTAEANPHVDRHRIFLYGWSEGSTIAAALAARHPEIAGLIVQGPVATPWRAVFRYQVTDVGVPYLRMFAPDGRVTDRTLLQAERGSGGLVARSVVIYLEEPRRKDEEGEEPPEINPYLDTNHDGAIEIDTEFLPVLDDELDLLFSSQGPYYIYSAARALPTVTAQAPRLHLPVLILQGANDSNVPASGARVLNAALATNPDHALRIYPGLGHSLGPATSPIDDDFRPIAPAPLADLAAWLARHR